MTVQQEKEKGDGSSSRGSSVVDEPPLELTAEVLNEYSHSQVVNNFLNVLVIRKYVDGKNRYEVCSCFPSGPSSFFSFLSLDFDLSSSIFRNRSSCEEWL
jgi:hypothetical protein